MNNQHADIVATPEFNAITCTGSRNQTTSVALAQGFPGLL